MQTIRSLLDQKATDKGLVLTIETAPPLAHQVLVGDPLRLEQILINLVGNAIKFSDHGEIRLGVQAVEEDATGILLRFEVCDEGIGISSEDQQRLFIAFEQADGSMTRKYGGTGLGLAISKRLVEMMGGEIGVRSAPGTGSTFWFTVRMPPAADKGSPPTSLPAQETIEEQLRRQFAGARILVVEDEPTSAEVLNLLLAEVGLAADVASDGLQGVALAAQQRYDAILMDMRMPHLSGLEATRKIRADSLNRHTPILAMTANAFEQDRQQCLSAGMDAHLAKPVNALELYTALLKWLGTDRSGT